MRVEEGFRLVCSVLDVYPRLHAELYVIGSVDPIRGRQSIYHRYCTPWTIETTLTL